MSSRINPLILACRFALALVIGTMLAAFDAAQANKDQLNGEGEA